MPVKLTQQVIDPIQGCLLIELMSEYKNLGTVTDERFGTSKLRGKLLALASDITPAKLKEIGAAKLKVGDIVYFDQYEDTAKYGPDKNLALIKLEEIRGRSDATD